MISVADYVVQFLVKQKLTHVFTVAGGGIMYLLDGLARNKRIATVSTFHEQAAATAAESYAKVKGLPGVCFVTTGPGSTNAITGVSGAWVDSVPLLVVAGQVKREVIANYAATRQKAPQEINIQPMVTPVTKYTELLTDPTQVAYELEKAWAIALEGRPGPVWITIPLDIQSSQINPSTLRHFSPISKKTSRKDSLPLLRKMDKLIAQSQRPVLVLGRGFSLQFGQREAEQLVNHLKMPTLLTIGAFDLLPETNPWYMGRFGPMGQRRGNIILQNADLLISLGASLNISSTGFDGDHFAFKAKKIVVNVDQGELDKLNFPVDVPICTSVQDVYPFLMSQPEHQNQRDAQWNTTVREWKKKYPSVEASCYEKKKTVNTYVFFDSLSKVLEKGDVIVSGVGQDVVSFYQSFQVKSKQHAFVQKNFGQMGWCLPAAVGACIGAQKQRTILVTGDGSFQFNIHELSTIRAYRLPIIIFVFNNKGYKTIRDTHNNLFEGRIIGADEQSGLYFPNIKALAKAYDLQYKQIKTGRDLEFQLINIIKGNNAVLCEVYISPDQPRVPRLVTTRDSNGVLASSPLEDMYPFLPRREVSEYMNKFSR